MRHALGHRPRGDLPLAQLTVQRLPLPRPPRGRGLLFRWRRGTVVVAASASLACSTHAGAEPLPGGLLASHETSTHRVFQIAVTPEVSLEVLDWGGAGPALVLVAGLGNTAHVFDDFAPLLTHGRHVVGVTRRGFGASTGSGAKLDLDTLVDDLVRVLDLLGIEDAVWVAHSFGGDEITELAVAHPERARALVYLDAAYDRTGLPALSVSAPYPDPPAWKADEDPRTVEGWGAYLERFRGVHFPRDEVSALVARDEGGALAPRPAEVAAMSEILTGVRAPALDRLSLPVLAVFAVPGHLGVLFPYITDTSAPDDRRRAQRAWEVYRWWGQEQVRRFQRAVADGQVVVLSEASHLLFLSDPEEVAGAVTAFLDHLEGR